jgi:tetratricopeptide (TPR) repeat protein
LHEPGRLDQAIAVGREAVELAAEFSPAAPDEPGRQELRAQCHHNYANALLESKRFSEALAHYQKSIEIREGIDSSKYPIVIFRLARALVNQGLVLELERQYAQAEVRFERAEQLLLSKAPDLHEPSENVEIVLGEISVNWTRMLIASGRFERAVDRADVGLKRLEPYLRTEPNDAMARLACLRLHGNRGCALSGQGKHRESVAEWTRVLELSDQPVPPRPRIQLAIALLSAGEPARALGQARQVKPAPEISGEDCYNLACLFSRSAAAARDDNRVAADERPRRAAPHVSDALRWLKAAAAAGFFQDTANRDHARKDSDLEILRDRAEFRQLVESNAASP